MSPEGRSPVFGIGPCNGPPLDEDRFDPGRSQYFEDMDDLAFVFRRVNRLMNIVFAVTAGWRAEAARLNSGHATNPARRRHRQKAEE